MNQVIEKLRHSAKKNGFITFDQVFNLSEQEELSLVKTEKLIGQLLDEGYLVLEEIPNKKNGDDSRDEEEDQYDKSQLDYENIFQETLEIAPQLSIYFDELRNIPPPQKGEEANLITLAKEGNIYAKHRLLTMFLKIVVKQALYFHKKTGFPLDDAIQEGNIGLLIALKKFKMRSGRRFSTYAPWWIRQRIQRAFYNTGRTIRLPVHMLERVARLKKIQKGLNTISGNPPNIYDIAIHSKFLSGQLRIKLTQSETQYHDLTQSEKKKVDKAIKKVKEVIQYSQQILSLDKNLKGRNSTLADIIPNHTEDSVDVLVLNSLCIEDLFNVLSDREKTIIELRYGFRNDEIHSLEEIGKLEGVTRERIRQIETKALQKMNTQLIIKKYQ